MSDIILRILEFIVVIAVVAVTRYVIPWFKSNIAINENEILIDIVNTAVMYAEQTLDTGAVKKKAVMDLVLNQLSKRGIVVTEDQVNALVEAAVFAMNKMKTSE